MARHILVIEHTPSMRERVRTALRGHEMEFAESGATALEAARRSPPAVIVMDVKMPGSSGFEICGKLQASSETRDIPVLFMTASSIEPQGLLEDSEYIVKPLDFATLKGRIEMLLKEREGAKVFRETYSVTMAGLAVHPAQELTESESRELAEGGFPVHATVNPRPIAERAAEYAALVSSGFSTSQVAARLGVNTSRIRQRLLDRPPTLYGIRKDNEWILPAFQFQKKDLVPNIDKVIAHLDPGLDLVAVYRWFTGKHPDLVHENEEVSPLDWLRQGLAWKPVVALAEDL